MEFRELSNEEWTFIKPLLPPRTRPKEVYADSAYDTKEIRRYLRRRGIKASIDINPRNRLKLKRGRQNKLKSEAYKRLRSAVERFFA